MLSLFPRAVEALLGEERMAIRTPFVHLSESSGFIAVESKKKGYRYKKTGEQITLRRVNPLAIVAGLPPLYYFRGTVRPSSNGVELDGYILLHTLPKIFILIWIVLVIASLMGVVIWAAFLAVQFMISSVPAIKQDLATAGFMIGGISVLAIFGISVITTMRLIARSQKFGLRTFLLRAQESGLTAQAD